MKRGVKTPLTTCWTTVIVETKEWLLKELVAKTVRVIVVLPSNEVAQASKKMLYAQCQQCLDIPASKKLSHGSALTPSS